LHPYRQVIGRCLSDCGSISSAGVERDSRMGFQDGPHRDVFGASSPGVIIDPRKTSGWVPRSADSRCRTGAGVVTAVAVMGAQVPVVLTLSRAYETIVRHEKIRIHGVRRTMRAHR
jgi:hypothetical protein